MFPKYSSKFFCYSIYVTTQLVLKMSKNTQSFAGQMLA